MFLSRNSFAVSLVGNLPRPCRDRAVACGIVPERADSVGPRLHFVLCRQLRRLERHPLGDRQDASAATDTFDSDGIPNGAGFTVVSGVTTNGTATDLGFFGSSALNPGTGTPGYWKNHPDAWPVNSIVVGGITYTKDEAIAWLGKVGKDKLTTMFSSLVPAMLNVMIGNENCVSAAIAAGNAWMATYGPIGTKTVLASSQAWAIGEQTHMILDAYNNGLACAPHRQ
jgi:hypothetical protein